MKKFWIVIVVIIVIVVAVILINKKPQVEESNIMGNDSVAQDQTPVSNSSGSETLNPEASKSEVVFTVNGGNFYFKPNMIKVKQGDTVKITFTNDEGFHDFKIDEFNVATARVQAGQSEQVTFVASKKGSFEYYCSVGTHRQMGMKGTLVVE